MEVKIRIKCPTTPDDCGFSVSFVHHTSFEFEPHRVFFYSV